MIKLLAGLLMLCHLSFPAYAATQVVEIYFLSPDEAAEIVKSKLSPHGKVAQIPSRQLLLIEDDPEYIAESVVLLRRLDQPLPQFTATVEIEDVTASSSSRSNATGRAVAGPLSGGWVQLSIQHGSSSSRSHQKQMLRITSGKPGTLETGIIRAFSRETLFWLSGYGLVKGNSTEIVPITSGFTITAWPVGKEHELVRVRITPWMQRLEPQASNRQMLVDLGGQRASASTANNAKNPVIQIAGAATEVMIPIDQTITIAAANNEAARLGRALLGAGSSSERREFVIRLRISR